MSKFILLGSSSFALDVLDAIFQISDTYSCYVIDSEISKTKVNIIYERFKGKILKENILDAACLKNKDFIKSIKDLDLVLSVHFMEILGEEIIKIPKFGVVNIHSSYLPYNRGNWPEIWSIYKQTPAGVTLHYINEGIDTGPIIAQENVDYKWDETSEVLFKKIEATGLSMIKKYWKDIISSRSSSQKQKDVYALNKSSDIYAIEEIKLDDNYRAKDLINKLRALTLPSYLPGAFFIDPDTGDKIRINISLKRERSK